jgi:LCP family protein required for cell wall assembly
MSPLRIIFLAVLASAVAAVGGGVAYFIPAAATAFQSIGPDITIPSPSPSPSQLHSPTPHPSPVVQPGGPFTVLLLGSDDDSKFSADHVLTQSMILVRVIPATKRVIMLSIPRDLYVQLSPGGYGKIDGAYSYGGPSGAIATVADDFGVHIDYYIWIGLLGLIKLIDAIGGIDVVTTHAVLDDLYPADIYSRFPFDYQRVAVLPGPQHLDGLQAMQYVRSRHGDLQSDFGRSQRQQQVLLAIRTKAKQLAPEDIPSIAAALSGELKTNISLTRVIDLLPLAASLDNPDSITQIVLLPPYTHGGGPGGSILPDWGAILPLVQTYFP